MRHVTVTAWESGLGWAAVDPVSYADPHVPDGPAATFRARTWHGPVVQSAFPATELIPSWNARTPIGSWLHVEGRVESDLGWTPWFTFARWTEDDLAAPAAHVAQAAITRTTVPGQAFEAGRVANDTFVADPSHPFRRWQLRVTGLTLEADPTASSWPQVALVTAAVCAFDIRDDESVSPPGAAAGLEIAVPPLSQRRHADSFPEWDSGGQSWCSPTSTTMLLAHWGLGPTPDEVAWIGHDTDPAVVHAVRRVFDRSYGGAGNWAFNTAYASTRGLRAYVTRLRDLTEAEAFIAAGIPLVVSVSFDTSELDGAGYSTRGHLLTIIGFTDAGDVISNDPNSHRIPSNDQVRAVFRRDQFERAWLRHWGGLTYVMHPRGVTLPVVLRPDEPNWA